MAPPRRAILSIQSQVAYGHVGNSAAVLPLQRLGFDVFPLNTVQLAHHPGYGAWRGHQVQPEQLDEILGGLRTAACSLAAWLCSAAISAIREWRAWSPVRSRRSVPRALERRTAAIP